MGFIAYPAAAEHSDAVPAADAVTNTAFRHVIGNKEDVANETADQASLVGLNRQVLVEAREIKRHHHNWGIGIGPAASASGTDHVADALGATAAPAGVQTSFTLACAANNDWGTEVQICTIECQAGIAGSGDGQFDLPVDLTADSDANVYVADWDNNRIQKFDSGGNFIYQWGQYGDSEGDLSEPYGVAVDASGNVYVADSDNNRIQKFDSGGGFQRMWGWGVDDGSDEFQVCTVSCQAGIAGSGDGQFDLPAGVAASSDGHVYVADLVNNRIQKFDLNERFLVKWGSERAADGLLDIPIGVAADAFGNVYVADAYNNRIQKFDPGGEFQHKWG